jgi:hypothetical protein
MTTNTIDTVFDELKRLGQCESRTEFSRHWLGRNDSYYRSIQCKKLKPSAAVQLNLASRLRDLGTIFIQSEHSIVGEIGKTYLRLYNELHDALLTGAQSDAVNSDCNESELVR